MNGAAAMWPLPQAVIEAAQALPNGDLLARHRAAMLGDRKLRETMRRVEGWALPAPALAELWLWLVHLHLDMGSRPSTTCASYGRTVGRFLRWCRFEADAEPVDHREARLKVFERWQRWLAVEVRNGEVWRKQQVMALRNFYDWRRSRGLATSNVAADLRAPRSKPKPAKKYTDAQLQGLFRAVDAQTERRRNRDRLVVLLLLTTGMRREELSRLSLGDIELGRNTGVVRIAGKGAKERDVPFEGPVCGALRDWLQERESLPFEFDRDALFVAVAGPTRGARLAVKGLEQVITALARKAKLREWGVHRFRVTFATQLYDDGADIETIRALMGHESIETTRRYLAVSERARRTRLNADRQHHVLGTKPTGKPLWSRLAAGELTRD